MVSRAGICYRIINLLSWWVLDSTYAERYLSFPNVTDNYKGYEEGDLSKYVDNLRDKQFLLIHGTADDNVHLQQSMVLSRALTNKGVLYKQQIYPDEGHQLNGVKRHLYRSMTAFFDDCFKKLVSCEKKRISNAVKQFLKNMLGYAIRLSNFESLYIADSSAYFLQFFCKTL